jgi:striatin 1/3/4
MKGRIARLEGSTRKSDNSNKSLKKYVSMLEKALKERDSQVKALKAGADVTLGESIKDRKIRNSESFKKPRRELARMFGGCYANLDIQQIWKFRIIRSWT